MDDFVNVKASYEGKSEQLKKFQRIKSWIRAFIFMMITSRDTRSGKCYQSQMF